MDFSLSDLNFNSVETLPGFEARAAFTVNSSSVFKEDVDIVPTIVDDILSYIPWGGDNQMPFDLLATHRERRNSGNLLVLQRRSLLRLGAAILRP